MKSMETAPIFYLIHEVFRAFRRQLEEQTRGNDLTLPQWRTVTKLGRENGMSQVALASALDTDPMTMSSILKRLTERELVQREPDPQDGRAKIVTLTPEGRALFSQVEGMGVELYKTAIAGMAPAETAALIEGLSRIRDNLSGGDAETKD
ncbi:MarR family winged helix-turn-helix transcriptional regulator [Devosia soli]|nr:MarR family transcriptional regulator [Devosia soli]